MKIFVCVKQVPDTRGKVYLKKDGSLNRARMATIINPDDLSAVENALAVKEQTGATVIAVTMGPLTSAIMMHELYAMGVDETVIISARELVGSDTYGTSQVLAAAIMSLGFGADDMIICGQQAIDGDTAQVGPELAEKLDVAQLTNVSRMEYTDGAVVCSRDFEDCCMKVWLERPCLVCVKKDSAKPRYMNISRIIEWESSMIQVIDYAHLKTLPLFDENVVGSVGAPTIVLTTFALPKKSGGVLLEGSSKDMASRLVGIMGEKNLI